MTTTREFLDEFHELLANQITEELVVKKLAAHDITLSRRERRSLTAQLQRGDTRLRLRRWELRWWKTEHIDLEPTDAEIEQAKNAYSNVLEKAPEVFASATKEYATAILDDLRKRWKAESRAQRRELRGFRWRQYDAWKEPFEKLRMMITICREAGGMITNDLKHSADATTKANLIEVMGRLHARGCQVAEEVSCLLEGGFADGAMARWRCLHEAAVTAKLIATHGEPLAERFVAYHAVDAAASAKVYQECAPVLGFELLDDAEKQTIEAERAQAIATYGPTLANGQYGWAATAVGKNSPLFKDLEIKAGLGHLRPFYKLACHNVHVDPNGVFYRLGLMEEPNVWLAGPSNIGLTDPGQCAAQSLAQLVAAHGSLDLTVDTLALVRIVSQLVPEIAEAFAGAEAAIVARAKQ